VRKGLKGGKRPESVCVAEKRSGSSLRGVCSGTGRATEREGSLGGKKNHILVVVELWGGLAREKDLWSFLGKAFSNWRRSLSKN